MDKCLTNNGGCASVETCQMDASGVVTCSSK